MPEILGQDALAKYPIEERPPQPASVRQLAENQVAKTHESPSTRTKNPACIIIVYNQVLRQSRAAADASIKRADTRDQTLSQDRGKKETNRTGRIGPDYRLTFSLEVVYNALCGDMTRFGARDRLPW